ncbi:hypothetical protein BCR33DRAFT_718337 [Rhizoclosmatium globosum]|uniref:DUF6570 domain-containing protein n=1 Tax=Rhizoclosmatium globosum TaxID=329046 RepID=A0A1Y2C6H2_9FUNG|nr:hypothetical protein BCR33DRAFT_718337 [Rhizoclosmatium globosum]|eukprot:ORY42643.1 hypothetical protein BCR33DRAFT_718337 [Rhizoclosmatium globosum]
MPKARRLNTHKKPTPSQPLLFSQPLQPQELPLQVQEPELPQLDQDMPLNSLRHSVSVQGGSTERPGLQNTNHTLDLPLSELPVSQKQTQSQIPAISLVKDFDTDTVTLINQVLDPPPVIPTSTSCSALTQKGAQCTRKAGPNGLCYQHKYTGSIPLSVRKQVAQEQDHKRSHSYYQQNSTTILEHKNENYIKRNLTKQECSPTNELQFTVESLSAISQDVYSPAEIEYIRKNNILITPSKELEEYICNDLKSVMNVDYWKGRVCCVCNVQLFGTVVKQFEVSTMSENLKSSIQRNLQHHSDCNKEEVLAFYSPPEVADIFPGCLLSKLGVSNRPIPMPDVGPSVRVGPNEEIILNICPDCVHDLEADKLPQFAINNHLWFTPLPERFNHLTQIEKMMCCPVQVGMNLITVTGGYGRALVGHCHFFPSEKPPVLLLDQHLPPVVKVILTGSLTAAQLAVVEKKFNIVQLDEVDGKPGVRQLMQYLKDCGSITCDIPDTLIAPQIIFQSHELSKELGELSSHQNTTPDQAHEPIVDVNETPVLEFRHTVVLPTGKERFGGTTVVQPAFIIQRKNELLSNYNGAQLTKACAHLFQYGQCGPTDVNRVRKIPVEKYLIHLMQIQTRMFATDPTFMGCAIDLIASKSSTDSAKFKLSNYGPDPGAIDRENLEAWLSYQENCQLSLNKGLPLPAKPEFDPNVNSLCRQINIACQDHIGSSQQMKLGRMISEAEMLPGWVYPVRGFFCVCMCVRESNLSAEPQPWEAPCFFLPGLFPRSCFFRGQNRNPNQTTSTPNKL